MIRPATNVQSSPEFRSVIRPDGNAPVIRPATNTPSYPEFRSVENPDDFVPVIRPATNVDQERSKSVIKIASESSPYPGIEVSIQQNSDADDEAPLIRPATNTHTFTPALSFIRKSTKPKPIQLVSYINPRTNGEIVATH